MSAIKITSADKYFSLCVRSAHNYTCERCGKVGRMECSHVHSRKNRTIRWAKDNANCLCHYCHRIWHENPLDSFKWFESVFGEGRVSLLIEKKNRKVKIPKSEEKEIAKHYREELKKIEQKRAEGVTGYIDFISYQ